MKRTVNEGITKKHILCIHTTKHSKSQLTTSFNFASISSEVNFLLKGLFRNNISQKFANNSGHFDSGTVLLPLLGKEKTHFHQKKVKSV